MGAIVYGSSSKHPLLLAKLYKYSTLIISEDMLITVSQVLNASGVLLCRFLNKRPLHSQEADAPGGPGQVLL